MSETVSRCIKEVLAAVCLFAVDVIKLEILNFTSTSREIAMNPRYMSHFKVRKIFVNVVSIQLKIVLCMLVRNDIILSMFFM